MGGLLHGMLFSKPTTTWQLDSAPAGSPFAWLTQQESETFAAPSSFAYSSSSRTLSDFASYSAASPTPLSPDGAGAGIWISNASGNWGTPSNWFAGAVPSGMLTNAHFDTLDITTDVTVTVETSRLVGSVYTGDTNGTNHYTLAPSGATTLTFDNAGSISILQQSFASAGDTISVPILLKNDLQITNVSPTKPFTISGGISSSATGLPVNIYFNSGNIIVSGDITPGTTGSNITLNIGNAVVTLTGTNTYTGSTFVQGGTLFVKGDNSAATGLVQVAGSGSVLSGIGTVGGPVVMFGSTISGGDLATTGKLTLSQSLNMNSSEGGASVYFANLDVDTSDLLAIGGLFTIGSGSTLKIDGVADGTTTFVLATFGSRLGTFDSVVGIPSGYDLVYSGTDIELVPIPEPATWIGGALALGAVGCAFRARKAESLKS